MEVWDNKRTTRTLESGRMFPKRALIINLHIRDGISNKLALDERFFSADFFSCLILRFYLYILILSLKK